MRTQQEDGHCQSGRELLPGTKSASTLILGSPAARTMRNKHLLLKLPSLWYFVTIGELRLASGNESEISLLIKCHLSRISSCYCSFYLWMAVLCSVSGLPSPLFRERKPRLRFLFSFLWLLPHFHFRLGKTSLSCTAPQPLLIILKPHPSHVSSHLHLNGFGRTLPSSAVLSLGVFKKSVNQSFYLKAPREN